MVKFSVKLSNILGLSFYRYELTSNNYNPNIDSAITLTVKVTDIFGNPVNNKTVQLYHDGSSMGSSYQLTTNTNGIATATYTVTHFGIHDFSVANQHIQLEVGGWKQYKGSNWGDGYYCVMYNKTTVRFTFAQETTFSSTTSWADFPSDAFTDLWIRPYLPVIAIDHTGNRQVRVRDSSTKIAHRSNTGATMTGTLYIQMTWQHRGIP